MRFIRAAEMPAYNEWDRLPAALQGLGTRVVYITPGGFVYHLYGGPAAGRQGVQLQDITGEHHWPFELLVSEGAYELGATVERVNVLKREITTHVVIGGQGFNEYQFRMAAGRWWAGQDENRDGWLGIYTRYSGWRWLRVRPAQTVDAEQPLDPTAFGNNTEVWPIRWLAQKPYWSKPSLWGQWTNSEDTSALFGVGEGRIVLANRSDMAAYPQYIVSAPGKAWVQDGISGRMVELPLLAKTDGYVLVDTDPTQRTLTASGDPVDNAFYVLARQSKILDFLLWELDETGLPVWQRFDKRFMSSVPPKTVAALRVKHSHPNGTITAIMSQRYKRSR